MIGFGKWIRFACFDWSFHRDKRKIELNKGFECGFMVIGCGTVTQL